MDEYERASEDLTRILSKLDVETYSKVVDPNTSDAACRSVQTVMNHVVRAGYGYANYLRQQFGEIPVDRKSDYSLIDPKTAVEELELMLSFTEDTLKNKWELSEEEMSRHKFTSSWGQEYDIEQILEHAIVHILRHRRQIERFLLL